MSGSLSALCDWDEKQIFSAQTLQVYAELRWWLVFNLAGLGQLRQRYATLCTDAIDSQDKGG